jgi:hypothetical protein
MGLYSSVSGEAPKSRAALAKALEKAIGFSEKSLEKNRRGELDAEQRRILMQRIREPLFPGAVAIVIFLALWTMYGTMVRKLTVWDAVGGVLVRVLNPGLIYRPDLFTSADKTPLILAGAALAFITLLIFVFLHIHPGLWLDLWAKKVAAIQGKLLREEISNDKDGNPAAPRYYFVIRDQRFEVSEAAFQAIDEGGIYTLFFAPRSRTIVAVQVDREADPEPESPVGKPLPELIPFHPPAQ